MLNLTTQHNWAYSKDLFWRMNILRFKQFNDEYIVQYREFQ